MDKGLLCFLVEYRDIESVSQLSQGQFIKMLKRGVRGVAKVEFGTGLPVVYIRRLGRGALQCEQELKATINYEKFTTRGGRDVVRG
jgi:hypothetical protein